MISERKVSHRRLEVRRGVELHVVDFLLGRGQAPRAHVILVHGFTSCGAEKHRLFIRLADRLIELGFGATLFDFEGCGYSSGRFEDFLVSSAIDDLDVLVAETRATLGDDCPLVLFGQSLGSAIALEVAARSRVVPAALVLWNLSGNIPERYPRLFGTEHGGDPSCVSGRGDYVGPGFLDDALCLDASSAADRVKCPVLFLGCSGDDILDRSIMDSAFDRADGVGSSLMMLKASHSFVCERDLESEAIEASIKWLNGVGL